MKEVKKISPHLSAINKMLEVESVIANLPNARFGDDTCPLIHSFADGLYIREILMPKGMLISSKLHKTKSPYFVLEGVLSVITDESAMLIKAPCWGITKAGTKRILYIHEDTRWITVHATAETDLRKIEDEIIAKTYDELPDYIKSTLELHDKESRELCHSQL